MTTVTMLKAPAIARDVKSGEKGDGSALSGQASRPPPETYMTLDGLLRSHAAEDDDIPLVGYPKHGVADYEVHTAKDISRYVDTACWWYEQQGLKAADPTQEAAPVCALLTPSCFEAIITFYALNRMGWAVLFLSTRLSAPAYVSLMGMAKASAIISPPTYNSVILEIQGSIQCSSLPRIESADFRNNQEHVIYQRACDMAKECRKIAWIIHSSGSTGFPKPIYLTNYGTLANWRKGLGLRSFTVSPLFHSHALMELGRATYAKKPMYTGNYAFPVTRQNLLAAMQAARPELVCAVPYVLKLLGETEEGIAQLAKAKVVMSGGSACPDTLGDELVEKGVHLASNYGSTEVGFIMNSYRPWIDREWSYLRMYPPVTDFVLMDEISPGVFECVALDGLPSKVTSNSDDPPNSFRTRDLFTRHPDPLKSNYWKYLSRLDDRLTLVNGEKVLPIPIEGRIRRHELVREAAIFGAGRDVPGLILFPSEKAADMTPEAFLDTVWPTIEDANTFAETFSHITRDMVVVMPVGQEYPRTDKGTFIRAQLYEQFAKDISRAYERFEDGNGGGSLALELPELELWLLEQFSSQLHIHLDSVDSDIFSAGVDSLQTTRLWNIIKKELDLGGRQSRMSQNIVFERGTVASLAKYLNDLRLNIQENEEEDAEVQYMQSLIDKYSTFSSHVPDGKPQVTKDTVLITGTTGGLGSWLLASVLERPNLATVWTLVRAKSNEDARERVLSALASRKISLSSSQLAKLVCLPSDFSQSDLGLQQHDLEELLSSLTHVIHSAWAVNFNLPTRSFEDQHIKGIHNFINICLQTKHSRPAAFYFCSSISTASGTPKPAVVPERQVSQLQFAQKMGYGRSKLVAEKITFNAMQTTGMEARVLRIGQLGGDTKNAVWNDTEAIALMIRSALSTGCLPDLQESPSWLPIDKAAETIEELVFQPCLSQQNGNDKQHDPDLVYHVLNPKTFSWSKDLLPSLSETTLPAFEVVETHVWLQRLKSSNPDPSINPSIKLVDFWSAKYGSAPLPTSQGALEDTSTQGLTFETKQTIAESKVLSTVGTPVHDGLMARIVDNWVAKWTST